MRIQQIVNNILESNSYILSNINEKQIALVDIGDFDAVMSNIEVDHIVSKVFLTHTHYDHIYGLPKLLEKFPECLIYTSCFGKEALKSPKTNLSKYHNDPIICKSKNVITLYHGESVKLFDSEVKVIATPGHDKSCLSYLINNNLFSGDSLIPGYKVISTLPNSDKERASKSESYLSKLARNKNLYPGHKKIYIQYG